MAFSLLAISASGGLAGFVEDIKLYDLSVLVYANDNVRLYHNNDVI